jgi:inosose dehydratase
MSDRRSFLQQVGSLGAAWCSSVLLARGAEAPLPNPVGYAAISWPENQFEEALTTIAGLGFKGVQMLGWVREAYAGTKTQALADRLAELRLQPVTLSCSELELTPGEPGDEVAQLRAYAAFFQRLKGLYLQITDGGRPNRKYSAEEIQSLGRRMNILGGLAREFGLTLGYHPHFGTIGETRQGLGRVLDATDPRYVKLIADVGHLALGGADPAEVIRTYHERLIFLHFKDVRNDVFELARKNRDLVRKKEYHFCEIGTGAVDFPAIIQAFRDTRFKGWVIVELDGYEPRPGGPAESARINKQGAQRLGFQI